MRKLWWVALASSLSCDDHLLGDAAPVGISCLRDPPLTYENFGGPLMDRHCNSCHSVYSREGQRAGAPPDVNFDHWEDVLGWADRIYARTVEDENMPPAGGMVSSERELVGEWMRCEVFPALGVFDEGTTTTEEGGT